MRKVELQVDVSESAGFDGKQHLACSVYLPDVESLPASPIVIFAVPGGGYSRGYYDMHFKGHEGYSEAEYHTRRGIIFISCDHLGVGASSLPDPDRITLNLLAKCYAACVRRILEQLDRGEIDPAFPPVKSPVVVGIGQSMGGCVTVLTQGQHRVFDGVGILGYSGIHTRIPQKDAADQERAIVRRRLTRDADVSKLSVAETSSQVADFIYAFHWEDVPAPILEADMGDGFPRKKRVPPFGSVTLPPCAVQMVVAGAVAEEAAAIQVPVLIAVGERDVCPDPYAEPKAYSQARDIMLAIIPRMAHMHNFASTRERLWRRTHAWARLVSEITTGGAL